MKYLLYRAVRAYKKKLSPGLNTGCIYTPTCSEYAMTALLEYKNGKGAALSAKRILRCNQIGKGGYDPVPVNVKKHEWIL